MGKYIIKLKPLTPYFFGGEVTFGDGSNQNYLVKSNVLPQASALLGLVRYEVLRCNGLLSYSSDKKSKVDNLIGENGFNLESPAEAYGAIKSISPIFITDGNHYYTPMPMDFYHNVSFNSQNRCSYSQDTTKSTPIIDKFSWKTFETYKYWVGNNNEKVESDAIFQFIDQVGITKNNANDNKEKAFFKQTLIDFKNNYQFVFTADVHDSNFGNDTSVIVPFGGNRSMFEMTIEKIDDNFDWCQIFNNLHRDGRLLALGDAYLTNEERNACKFIWGMNTPMRYISQSNNGHSWKKPNKVESLYHLQSRGSVIFVDEDQLNNIKSESNFNKVGLNIFV